MKTDLNVKQPKGKKNAMGFTKDEEEQMDRELKAHMAKIEEAERTQSMQFEVRLWNGATVFYNPVCAPVTGEGTGYGDIPQKDYAGVVIINTRYQRPPIVLMVDDNSMSALISALKDNCQTELMVGDTGGMVINVLKKVIDHIEIPYGNDGLKAVGACTFFYPELPDEPQVAPIFRSHSYERGIAEEITSKGIKRTPMKYKSWKAKIRRECQRSLQKGA